MLLPLIHFISVLPLCDPRHLHGITIDPHHLHVTIEPRHLHGTTIDPRHLHVTMDPRHVHATIQLHHLRATIDPPVSTLPLRHLPYSKPEGFFSLRF